jgi:hypothetical protein
LFRGVADESRRPSKQHVPEPPPVLDIVIDEQRGGGIGAHVFDAAQSSGTDGLGLAVDRLVDRLP